MKPINLLPRVPLARRMYKPAIAAIAALTAVFAAGIIILYGQHAANNRYFEAEIARIDRRMAELTASEERRISADVAAYRQLVERLEGEAADWEPLFELAAELLPPNSSIVAMSADADGTVSLAARFPDLVEIASYAEALREAEPIADAVLLSLQRAGTTDADMSGWIGAAGAGYAAEFELRLADPAETGEGGP